MSRSEVSVHLPPVFTMLHTYMYNSAANLCVAKVLELNLRVLKVI